MDISYAIMPFVAWLFAGTSKFIINSVRSRKWAFAQIGYGGLPSTHSAIVTSTATLIALREGINSAMFAVAITLAFIVMLDANSLRRQIAQHAVLLNRLHGQEVKLRERIGHSKIEIAAGVITGVLAAILVQFVFAFWL